MDLQETRTKVLIAAADLFAAHGYYHVSVREICEAAGVSKPVLYYYFKDKDDLLLSLLVEVHSRLQQLFDSNIKPEESFEKNLDGLYQAYSTFALEYPYLIKLSTLIFFSPLPEKIKMIRIEKSNELKESIKTVFQKGSKEGILKNEQEGEMMALSLLGPIGVLLTTSVFLNDLGKPVTEALQEYFNFWKKKFLKN